MTHRSGSALIVAHGQPSDPDGPEREMAAFAARVARHLPGWQIGSATLAGIGTLDAAVRRLGAPLIFPFFMADGWFIRVNLPRRLAGAGAEGLTVLTPFGVLPETLALAGRVAADACTDTGWAPADTTLILAAHGSGVSRQPAEAATATRDAIAAAHDFSDIRLGFIEEQPYLADTLRNAGVQAVLLPLFVARWGHVMTDIPDAVTVSGFAGRILDPIGLHPDVPGIVARAIAAGA